MTQYVQINLNGNPFIYRWTGTPPLRRDDLVIIPGHSWNPEPSRAFVVGFAKEEDTLDDEGAPMYPVKDVISVVTAEAGITGSASEQYAAQLAEAANRGGRLDDGVCVDYDDDNDGRRWRHKVLQAEVGGPIYVYQLDQHGNKVPGSFRRKIR